MENKPIRPEERKRHWPEVGYYPPGGEKPPGFPGLPEPPKPYRIEANQVQIGGDHYKGKQIQPWDYIIANDLGYLEGNIVKYVSRYKDKKGIEDLEKAKHYLEKLIEQVRGRGN